MSTYRCEACGFTAEGTPTMVRLETGRYHFFVRHEGCGGRMDRVPTAATETADSEAPRTDGKQDAP